MADDNKTEALGPRPWTIKGISDEVRNAVIAAADREKQPLGEWASRAFLAKIQSDRQQDRAPVVQNNGLTGTLESQTAQADARLALIERAVASAVTLAGATEVPPGFRRRANRLLRESLPAAPARPGNGGVNPPGAP